MFSHVTVLLSFIFAIAITHLLTSATELIWARDRVRPSWLQVLWMFDALLGLLVNWIGMFFLSALPQWTATEITINFIGALVQYFTCSLISLRVKDEGTIDMPAFFARQRRPIFIAFTGVVAINMFQNWWEMRLLSNSDAWLYADLTIAPLLLWIGIGGWARAVWLQWTAGIAMGATMSYFLFTYAL